MSLVEIVSQGELFLAIFVLRNYVDSTEGLGKSKKSDNFAIGKLSYTCKEIGTRNSQDAAAERCVTALMDAFNSMGTKVMNKSS